MDNPRTYKAICDNFKRKVFVIADRLPGSSATEFASLVFTTTFTELLLGKKPTEITPAQTPNDRSSLTLPNSRIIITIREFGASCHETRIDTLVYELFHLSL